MATENFDSEIDDVGISPLEGILDDAGVFRLQTPNISSYNFDGVIGNQQLNIAASAVQPGMQISLTGSVGTQTYYTVLFVNDSDEELSASPSELVTIQYIDEEGFPEILSIGASAIISIQKENWEDKYLGENGWYIGTSGNAIFSNVAIRGEIEATTMDIGGAEGIIYDGNTVTIGASVVINAALTVGASGNFIVSGSAAQDIISNNTTITGGNIATGNIKSTGYSGPGTGSAFSTTGMSINLDDGSIVAPNFKIDNGGNAHFKGVVQSASGAIGGFTVSASQISIAGFTMSTASGIFLGDNRQFSVNTQGNLIATSASIVGDIRARSGTFSGSVSAAGIYGASVSGGIITGQQIVGGTITGASGTFTGNLIATSLTASNGNIGGFTTTNNSLNANNFAISTQGGLSLGTSNQFSVDTLGNLRATSASITGNIIATSGSFTGALNAAAGTFAGNLSAAGGTFAGSLSAAGGTFAGNLSAAGGTFSGNLSAAGGTFAGSLSAATGTFAGSLSAATGTFAGSLSAATGTFSGTLSANSITSGSINASLISVTNINANNITSGTISGDKITGGTITGTLISTGGSNRVTLNDSSSTFGKDSLSFYSGNVQRGIVYWDTIGNELLVGGITRPVRIDPSLKVNGNTDVFGTLYTGNKITIAFGGLQVDNGGITNSAGAITSLPTYNNDASLTNNVHINASGVFRRNSSTQKKKYNIIPISGELSNLVSPEKISNASPEINYKNILNLTPVQFSPIENEEYLNKNILGFIAEDIADKMPEIASYDANNEPEYYDVNGIVAALLAVVKDQVEEINELKNRINTLERVVGIDG